MKTGIVLLLKISSNAFNNFYYSSGEEEQTASAKRSYTHRRKEQEKHLVQRDSRNLRSQTTQIAPPLAPSQVLVAPGLVVGKRVSVAITKSVYVSITIDWKQE